MPGRTFNNGNYRYGFNGKENDNEVKGTGNQQDYGMRIYDNRIGKFLSVDPLTKSYPFYTPYQFAGNNPICGIDLDGLEYLDHRESRLEMSNGYVTLKVENFHNVTQSAWKDMAYRNDPYPQGQMGYTPLVGRVDVNSVPLPPAAPDAVDLDTDYDATTNINQGGEYNLTKVESPTKKDGTPDMRYKGNKINKNSGGLVTTSAGSAKLAGAAMVLNIAMYAMEKINVYLSEDDQNKLNLHKSILFNQVQADLQKAIQDGVIPKENINNNDLSIIANIVLMGQESKNKTLNEIGWKIVREISKNERAPANTRKVDDANLMRAATSGATTAAPSEN